MVGTGTKEEQESLYRFIDGVGANDKYISLDEERDVVSKGASLNIASPQAEAMLNHRCRRRKWTRESDITFYLRVLLEAATKDDGQIDKKEFDQAITFAVALRMPRKDALRICCHMVREAKWQTKNEGLIRKVDWLSEYEK